MPDFIKNTTMRLLLIAEAVLILVIFLGAAVAITLTVLHAGSAYAQQSPATIRLCTGSESGNYYAAGKAIAERASRSVNIVVVATKGTMDNIDRTFTLSPEDPSACDAMIGQPDGATYAVTKQPAMRQLMRQVGQLHREYLHVLCSKGSGIGDISDLEGRTDVTVAIGEPGSGGWLVWQNFIAQDEDYGTVPTTNEGGQLAVSSIASDQTTCGIFPAGLGNGTIAKAAANVGGDLTLAEATDKDFNDALDIRGKPLYEWSDIPGGTYKGLAFWGTDTISWRAGVYVNKDRTSGSALEAFVAAVSEATPAIVATFGK